MISQDALEGAGELGYVVGHGPFATSERKLRKDRFEGRSTALLD
ncbi:MAG: hypothetical protein WBP10_05865 [Thermoanaerobaculia bacterium]